MKDPLERAYRVRRKGATGFERTSQALRQVLLFEALLEAPAQFSDMITTNTVMSDCGATYCDTIVLLAKKTQFLGHRQQAVVGLKGGPRQQHGSLAGKPHTAW